MRRIAGDPMKTLLFCTTYLTGPSDWEGRNRAWLAHVATLPIRRDATLLIDDGSPWLPAGDEVRITGAMPDALSASPTLLHLTPHLGRPGVNDFPGWLRSFFHSVTVARAHGFGRIVHIEGDARILSGRMARFLDEADSGWSAFWCPRYTMPECAIQVLCADAFAAAQPFIDDPRAALEGATIEMGLPFTHIVTTMKGDRYGETGRPPPADADYACQFDFRDPVVFRAEPAPAADAAAAPPARGLLARLFGRRP